VGGLSAPGKPELRCQPFLLSTTIRLITSCFPIATGNNRDFLQNTLAQIRRSSHLSRMLCGVSSFCGKHWPEINGNFFFRNGNRSRVSWRSAGAVSGANGMAEFPDWKKKSNYLTDPLEPYMGMIRSWKISAADQDFYRYMQWRWEFLRRHPQYIKGWRKASASHDLSNSMFGLVIMAPDPFEPRSFPVFFGKFPDDKTSSLLELSIETSLPIPG